MEAVFEEHLHSLSSTHGQLHLEHSFLSSSSEATLKSLSKTV
jgi:hypothetical protein